MPLLVQNGRIITATEDYRGDVYCAGEQITRIDRYDTKKRTGETPVPANTEIIDAAGKYVFPGFIDPHVHIYLPFMGTYAKDTWESASRAALSGGTTTLIEMICPAKTDQPMDAFELWCSKAERKSFCDYSFHMGVTRYDAGGECEKQFREIVNRGITSFKVFLAYKGALGVDDRELYHALKLAREIGVIVTAHCENETMIDERQRQLISEGKLGPEWHEPSRPTTVEAEGVHHLMSFAELTGASVYIVHTSCEEAVREALRGRERGVNVQIESVIPHLVLDKSFAERGGFEGAKYVMSPPLREKEQQEFLWRALKDRTISTIATDHAPFDFHGQKEMGKPPHSNFTRIPNGIPSVENRIDLLYTHGVTTGKIDLHRFVDCASTQAAKIFGLKDKGDIKVGMDADLCIYDPNHRGVISAKTHHMMTDYSAFEGWEVKGRADVVTVRGEVMVRDGKFAGKVLNGRLINR
jgi:dihydropyrimidinase